MSTEKELYENAIVNIECARDAVEDAIKLRRITELTPDRGLVWALRILEHETKCEPVPDPINDWNAAKHKQSKYDDREFDIALNSVWRENCRSYIKHSFRYWAIHEAQPKHYLIAAAMAAEGAKE